VRRSAAPEGQDFIVSSLSPSPAQPRFALGVVLVLIAVFVVAVGPLSTVPLPRIDSFIPMYATAMFVNDSITAVLLFAQFAILRSHALLMVASGYLFTALILIPWVLTFPGLFTPGGLLGAGLQSTAWLYFLWHAGFPVFVIAYALLKNTDPSKQRWNGSLSTAILLGAAVAGAAVCAATLFVTAGHALLPSLMRDAVSGAGSLHRYVAGCIVLVSVVALLLLWIRRGSVLAPDLQEAKAAFTHIVDDGHRAGAVISGLRAMFKKDVRVRATLDVNEIIRGVLVLIDAELARHRVSVQIELTESLPSVSGDRVQLQQVFLNLTTNAIEAMATTDGARALGVTSAIDASGGVLISVTDTGTGVVPEDVDRIFTPLFTTKDHGMGMGLSISRSIIEAHDGRLWAAPNAPCGSVFHFVLPADSAMAAGRQAAHPHRVRPA